jgi:hypothetical protein
VGQIFSPAADLWLRLFLAAVVVAAIAVFAVLAGYVRSDYITRRGWAREQPVPFSHEHHVGGLGIDCRYCHTGVETTASAGFPPTHTCMTCHSQIWTNAAMLAPVRQSLATGVPIRWERIAKLPEFVYFRHDAHIRAGVGCVTCHGRIDRMKLTMRAEPFQMGWCLACHRDPAPHLRPREFVTSMTWQTNQDRRALGTRLMAEHGIAGKNLTYCYTCHR